MLSCLTCFSSSGFSVDGTLSPLPLAWFAAAECWNPFSPNAMSTLVGGRWAYRLLPVVYLTKK